MTELLDGLSAAIDDATTARARTSKSRQKQVRSAGERQYLAAIAHTWFRSRRPLVVERLGSAVELTAIDDGYRRVLDSTDRGASRTTYLDLLKSVKANLMSLRGIALTHQTSAAQDDTPPDFSPLAADPIMRDILTSRWLECQRCLDVHANLAAIVMMGGLLEALFVARANGLKDKSPLFKAKSTPTDGKTKKALALREWTLAPYIAVGHELGWISQSARDVAVVLRDYRNYIHPEKERSHGVSLGDADCSVLWGIAKSLARQLLS